MASGNLAEQVSGLHGEEPWQGRNGKAAMFEAQGAMDGQ